MREKIYPLVAVYGRENDQGVEFLFPGRTVTIEGEKDMLLSLLRECDGYRTTKEIVSIVSESTGRAEKEIRELVEELLARHILVDSNRYYLLFHEASENPMPFSKKLSKREAVALLKNGESYLIPFSHSFFTPLEQLLAKRESVRHFNGEVLSSTELKRLAWAIYGKTGRSDNFPESSIGLGTIPSGGALYPLRLFVLAKNGSLGWIVYKGDPEGLREIGQVSAQQVSYAFLADPILDGAAAIYVIACDFWQTTQKYGNRGYRFALLEAGHAAQNAYLWCAEQNLGTVELGGFLDRELADILSLSYPGQAPLTVIVVGRRKML